MAAPVIVPCAKDAWTKVAENITSAVIHRISVAPNLYKQTYVLTGDPAPTDDSDAALMFSDSPNEEVINAPSAIDVYVKPIGAAGSVRLDA